MSTFAAALALFGVVAFVLAGRTNFLLMKRLSLVSDPIENGIPAGLTLELRDFVYLPDSGRRNQASKSQQPD